MIELISSICSSTRKRDTVAHFPASELVRIDKSYNTKCNTSQLIILTILQVVKHRLILTNY